MKDQSCLPTPQRLEPLRGWATQIMEGRECDWTCRECTGQLCWRTVCGLLGCLAAVTLSAAGHHRTDCTPGNRYTSGNCGQQLISCLHKTGRKKGLFVLRPLISLIHEKKKTRFLSDDKNRVFFSHLYKIIFVRLAFYVIRNDLNKLGLCVNVPNTLGHLLFTVSGQQFNSTSKLLWGISQGYHGINTSWNQEEPGTTLTGEPTRTKK